MRILAAVFILGCITPASAVFQWPAPPKPNTARPSGRNSEYGTATARVRQCEGN